jgi:CRISPR/Cas system CMR subunit Cmr6 (Cas7 group RAMP superfamily)
VKIIITADDVLKRSCAAYHWGVALANTVINCIPHYPPYGKGIRQGGESNSPTPAPWAAVDPTGHVSFELNLSSKSPMLGSTTNCPTLSHEGVVQY